MTMHDPVSSSVKMTGTSSATPRPLPSKARPMSPEIPNPMSPPSGCRFHPRCALAAPVCSQQVPARVIAGAQQAVSCLIHEPGSGHPMAQALAQAA